MDIELMKEWQIREKLEALQIERNSIDNEINKLKWILSENKESSS